jgi:hypothetical protein
MLLFRYMTGKTVNNATFLFDKADYKIVASYRWNIMRGVYVICTCHSKLLHRLIMNPTTRKEVVDHINGNPLDNRRRNMRLCLQAENVRNSAKQRRNKSGYKGVYLDTSGRHVKPYVACIRVNGKRYRTRCNTARQAALAYNSMARSLHKQYAGLNMVTYRR